MPAVSRSVERDSVKFEAGRALYEVEKAYILLTLAHSKTKKEAAEILGISLRTLHKRIAEFAAEEKKSAVAS
jgi:DNA-binding NtrC family response regulator